MWRKTPPSRAVLLVPNETGWCRIRASPRSTTANRTGTWSISLASCRSSRSHPSLKHRELVQLPDPVFINLGGVITIVEAPNASGFVSADRQTITT
jgi:hypothetical protein